MRKSYLQPGAYVLTKMSSDPQRVQRVKDKTVYFVVNGNEYSLSKNRIQWVESAYIRSVTVENMWVETV